ncbi:MAG: hypothetical protein EPO32_04620 [Anaerolineae bacterium]|nr:MAG: hypothetical protein EPO32_04620 [Anaerolineae bacterium]
MRTWNLKAGDPLCLSLTTDWRFTAIHYADDPSWEITLGRGDPAGITLSGTFGLRANGMRMLPRFTEGPRTVSAIAEFDKAPRLTAFAPNRLKLACAPFPGLDVILEYWAAGPLLLAGRVQIANNGVTRRSMRLDWVAILNPTGDDGQMMSPIRREAAHVLQGRTAGLWPVLFFTGGPVGSRSPYPALSQELDLLPGAVRRFTWALTSMDDPEEGFRLARQTAARNWEAEMARIEMMNNSSLDITTGDPDWDAAFALGQTQARRLLITGTSHLPNPSIVSTRQPDQGYSTRGDGSDYNHLWNGQSALEAWFLLQNLLPGQADTAKGLLRNFLAAQDAGGKIDGKPGLAGQRNRLAATPLLADLAWRIYEVSEDTLFLREVFPRLMDSLETWFNEQQDRDGDGIPEWDHPAQTGFDDNPAFSHWHNWAQGADIRTFESPDLCALLVNECERLKAIAAVLERPEPAAALDALADNLRAALSKSWDIRASTYKAWDRDSHNAQKGETLGSRKGSGQVLLDLVFDLPQRLLLRADLPKPGPLGAEAYVHGRLPSGQHRVEKLDRGAFHWLPGHGAATLDLLLAEVEHIQVENLPENATFKVMVVDHRAENHTQFLPFWAGIPNKKQAAAFVKRHLLDARNYARQFGLPALPRPPKKSGAETLGAVWLPWNIMAAEGLLRYGYRKEAAELVSRLMAGIVQNLKREGAFRRHIHADDGRGLGERDHLLGLPPLDLFLKVLGVRIVSPWKVLVTDLNPFPWPVRIQYRGLMVDCRPAETIITFPDGQSASVEESGAHWVSVDTL